jgi:hypothetical protein
MTESTFLVGLLLGAALFSLAGLPGGAGAVFGLVGWALSGLVPFWLAAIVVFSGVLATAMVNDLLFRFREPRRGR